jgi:hypothetical protein
VRGRFGAAFVLALACALPLAPFAPRDAAAQPAAGDAAELAKLRARFSDGIKLEEDGKWGEALEAFEDVARAKRTAAVVFHLALCHENLGMLKAALAEFSEAETLAANEGTSAGEVREKAARRRDALEPRVPTLRVTFDAGADGTVSVGGTRWEASSIGKDVAMDPGRVQVVVEKDGRRVFSRTVDLAEGEKETLRVPAEVKDDAPPVPPDAPPPPETPDGQPGNKIPAIVVGSVGLAAIASGAVLFGLGQARVAEVKETCNADFQGCDPDKQEVAEQGEAFHYASIGLLSGGAALLGVATVLWFTVGADTPPAQAGSGGNVRIMFSPMGVVVAGEL